MGRDNKINELRWIVYPLWDFGYWKSISLIILFIVILIIVKISFENVWFIILSGVLLFLALTKYFLPTKYSFTDEYVNIRHCGFTLKRDWNYYRSFFVSKTGIFLSPFEAKSWLENFRGNYILFGRDNKDEVIRFVRAKIEKEQ